MVVTVADFRQIFRSRDWARALGETPVWALERALCSTTCEQMPAIAVLSRVSLSHGDVEVLYGPPCATCAPVIRQICASRAVGWGGA